MGNPRKSNGAAWRAARARLRGEGRPCALCGQPIDYSLPAGDPWSFEVDHIVPVRRGGSMYDPANLQPAHRICNERKGAGMDGDRPGALQIRRSRLF